ncbi:MAG: DNA cytosine methyltransferase [Clostridia bacterium]|nr:DNA cytosine methyltransferase [Clostridia bacterium]
MVVLSLCDGMSCGQIALKELGFNIEKYYASEIKPYAIQTTQYNFPNTIQLGDVNKIHYNNGIIYSENGIYLEQKIDLVMFGSPCQSFSIAMPTHKRNGLEDKTRSGLFYECERIRKEVSPTYWFVENVASMKNSDKTILSQILECEPYTFDASDIGYVHRKRYYWTNIANITTLEKKNYKFQNLLENGYTSREKGTTILCVPYLRPSRGVFAHYRGEKRFLDLIYKSKEHYEECRKLAKQKDKEEIKNDYRNGKLPIFDDIRMLNCNELKKAHEIPEWYDMSFLEAKYQGDLIGDGWHIGIIKHIFKNIPKEL